MHPDNAPTDNPRSDDEQSSDAADPDTPLDGPTNGPATPPPATAPPATALTTPEPPEPEAVPDHTVASDGRPDATPIAAGSSPTPVDEPAGAETAGEVPASPAPADDSAADPTPSGPTPVAATATTTADEPEPVGVGTAEAREPAAPADRAAAARRDRSVPPPPPRRPPGASPPGPPRPLAAGQVVPVLADGFASGQIVSGKVVSVDQNEVVVDLGDRQGVINRRHLTVEGRTDPTELVAVGEEVEAAVLVREDPKNRVVLSRTWAAKQRAWQAVDASTASGEPLRGTVVKVVKGGVLVDIGVRAFLPVSQLELRHVDNLGSYVGRELDCLVAEADRTTDKIVLTRRSLLRRLDRQRTGELLAGLSEGQTLKGVVTRLADYGAFVRVLDRIEGLVHVSELAEYRVHLPEEVVIPGDEVMVKVLRIDRRRRRVDLSVNQAVQYGEAVAPPGPDAPTDPDAPAGPDVPSEADPAVDQAADPAGDDATEER